MQRKQRMKFMEESNVASGKVPEYGAIFMSNSSTRKECLRRELFGLPVSLAEFVKQVKAGMLLFLFDFETRELHGVFQASSDGAINIEPNAFHSSGKQFPAQVKFTEKWLCWPLPESEFRQAICENYFTATKFYFGLSKAQVQRLLKLFSSKKLERSRLRKTAVAKHIRTSESNLGNTDGNRGFGKCAKETDADFDCEFPLGVTSARDHGRRLTENYGFGGESHIGSEYDSTKGIEYSEDAFGVCRRLVDPEMYGSKDLVGYDFSRNNSFGTDALSNYSNYPVVNDQRVPKKGKHTTSGWLENEYHENDGIAQASQFSNHKERLNFQANPVVPAESSDPCELPTMNNSRHYIGAPAPNAVKMGSASYAAYLNNGLREETEPGGGYFSDTLPSEIYQPYRDEHNGTTMEKTSSLELDYYIPMPTEHLKYQTNTGMIGADCSESESGIGHLHHYQFPGLLTHEEATENMMNFEKLSNSNNNIFPSFANPLSPRILSPEDRVTNEISTYQHQEEFGGHDSYSKQRVVRDSKIYPSFTYPPTSGDGADLYPENRTHNEVQTYQQHEESGSDAFNSVNRVSRMKDCVNPFGHERLRTRKSVFSRLAMPSEEQDAKTDVSPDDESVDEVMTFLNDCHKHWMEQKRPNMSNHQDMGKQKRKREKIHTAEVLDSDLRLPLSETTTDDLLGYEESMEYSAQKLPFIDFKRRSKALKSHGNPTEGCKDNPEHSAYQNKKRKLQRPKLTEDDSEKDSRGNHDNSIGNDLASQSATEVPVPDFIGRGDQ